MMVKVCGITRREDAVAAVEAGASAIGFIFYPASPRYVTPPRALELGDGLDVLRVGVFVNETRAAIEAVMRSAKLDVAQVYGDAVVEGARVWRAVRVADRVPANPFPCDALFLDGSANGVSFDWRVARGAAEKVIIAGGLDASNVAEAIRVAEPWGVDASSGLESAPGIKDHEKVRRFIRAARETS
jgi:phosphoribosylanthranilate isomerase